jgi:hypothetical protein
MDKSVPRRFANRDKDYPKKDEQGNRVCRFCRKLLTKGVYCSKKCHEEVDIRCGFHIPYYMYKRDRNICADCGIDTLELDHALQDLLYKIKRQYYAQAPGKYFCRTNNSMQLFYAITRQCGLGNHLKTTEAFHHVVSVEQGGGCCGLDNLVTLCTRCHCRRHARKQRKGTVSSGREK